VHHSDQGCRYTSLAFGRALRAGGVSGSMGTAGDCFDNALAESFFATLQTELLDRHIWSTRRQLEAAIFDFIEAFYNPSRRHSSLGYLSPNNYEKMNRAAPAA
ncbi:MAG: integrase core domain-containing protein, partial [Actinomycetota bacterium]|nr:integrase core domain-containing protein [Actinomycetota bacterium]